MPTYVYRCKKGHAFELFHSISDDTRKRCPKCRCAAQRVPSGGAGLLFKGSGFHITDYRSKGYTSAASKDSASKPDASPAPAAGAGSDGAVGREPKSGGRESSGAAPPARARESATGSERGSRSSSRRGSRGSAGKKPRDRGE